MGSTASTQKGAADARDIGFYFRLIDQYFFRWRFVVGDGFQCDMRHDAADFLAFFVLFTCVDKTAAGAAFLVLELIVGIGGGEQTFASQCQRNHATRQR